VIDSLFQGKQVTLAALDLDADAEVISRWTHDPEFLHLTETEPARPLSPGQVRKKLQPGDTEGSSRFTFAVRTLEDDRLVGLARLMWVDWSNGTAWLKLEVGTSEDRGRGYDADALDLLLGYAFLELNLFRVTSVVFEYSIGAIHLLESAGFACEARLRESIIRSGRRWDVLLFGLIRTEWEKGRGKAEAAQ